MAEHSEQRERFRIFNREVSRIDGLFNSDRLRKDEKRVFNDEFALECLRNHNHYRTQHGCAPLHLSVEISRFSQQWADHLAHVDHLYHSHHPLYGENLYSTHLSDHSLPVVKGFEIVDSWYSEYKFYPFDGFVTKETLKKAGHFTQVIWNDSKQLGIGKAISKSNTVYVVANYYPTGNVLKKVKKNVPTKIFGSCERHFYNRRQQTKFNLLHHETLRTHEIFTH